MDAIATRIRTIATPNSEEVSIGSVAETTATPASSAEAQNDSKSIGRRTRRSSFHTTTTSMSPQMTV